jgi:hypothetical protein
MSAIETASPRASWSASETAPRISEDLAVLTYILILLQNLPLALDCLQGHVLHASPSAGTEFSWWGAPERPRPCLANGRAIPVASS